MCYIGVWLACYFVCYHEPGYLNVVGSLVKYYSMY